jgi:hypothetical protein
LVDTAGEIDGLGGDGGGASGDGDRLLYLRGLQGDGEVADGADCDRDVGGGRGEAVVLDADVPGAGGEVVEAELTVGVGEDAAGLRGAGAFDEDGGAADASAGGVLDDAAQGSAGVLCEQSGGEKDGENGEEKLAADGAPPCLRDGGGLGATGCLDRGALFVRSCGSLAELDLASHQVVDLALDLTDGDGLEALGLPLLIELGERALLESRPLMNAGGHGFAGLVVDGERLRWGGSGTVFRDVEDGS